MNRETRKDLIEVIGLIAIVGSLAFLIMEIRQNTTALTAGAWQARSEALQEMSLRLAESETLATIGASLMTRSDECARTDVFCSDIDEDYVKSLSPTQFQRFRAFLTAHAFRLQNLRTQYEYGLLTEEYYAECEVGAIRGFVPRWNAFDVPQRPGLAESVGISIVD